MRVLFLCHNHPGLQPGGTEAFARALFREMRDRRGVEGLFLAAATRTLREKNPGTLLSAAPGGEADEMLVALDHFDRFHLSQVDVYGLTATLPPLLARLEPDVIHLHHPLMWGVEAIDLLRRSAPPGAAMVATLHDYFGICPREGQLLTADGRLCRGPSTFACSRCFPDLGMVDLRLRETSLRDAFRAFDAVIAPSLFLRDRFVAAGWDPARIAVLPNAVPASSPAPHRAAPDGRRDRFAFFGHVNRFKGALVALGASAALSAQGTAHRLALHGGTAYQSEAFLAEFQATLAAAPAARHHGAYDAADLSTRIAEADWVVVPSIWWENAPLVILEAFRHRRPVICGSIGGMAELVRDGVNGLHAPVNDPAGLAAVMARAAGEEDLWKALVGGIQPPPDMAAAAERHLALYQKAVGGRGCIPPAQTRRKEARGAQHRR